jgi:hypothetical protein
MPERLLTSEQPIVDASALGFGIGKAELNPCPDVLGGATFESLQEESASAAVATGLALYEGATMKLSGRQHPIMMT